MKNRIQKTILAALLASLVCVATMLIKVPTPSTGGYVNLGDGIVILAAIFLGGPYGACAAAIGSALADLFSGYAAYIPATFIIKGLMALAASLVYRRTKRIGVASVVVAALVAEVIMVGGYFVFEALILGFGLAAASAIIPNAVQGLAGIITATVLYVALRKAIDIEGFKQ